MSDNSLELKRISNDKKKLERINLAIPIVMNVISVVTPKAEEALDVLAKCVAQCVVAVSADTDEFKAALDTYIQLIRDANSQPNGQA